MTPLRNLRSVLRFRPFQWRASRRRLEKAASIEDLRRIARKRLPRGVFDYIDGAAEDELSHLRNSSGFRRLEFNPRVLRNVQNIDTSVEFLGVRHQTPLILAPTGFTRIAHAEGELAVATAAQRFDVPYCLSSLSTQSIENVRDVTDGELWFQVYVWKDRGLVQELLNRAEAANYSTIVITVDTPVLGRRERDIRRGFTLPPKLGLATILDGVLHPAWTINFLRSPEIRFANLVGKSVGDGRDPISLSEFISSQFDPSLSWSDLDWFRSRWNGAVVIKGIQSVEDASIAVDHGINAIAVSNHGGRQLDGAPPPIDLIAPIRQQVQDDIEIFCDGGIRRGSDVVKALALGADACMVGRPYLYGLAVAGKHGVDQALEFLKDGLERTMALTGCRSIEEIGPELVRRLPTVDYEGALGSF